MGQGLHSPRTYSTRPRYGTGSMHERKEHGIAITPRQAGNAWSRPSKTAATTPFNTIKHNNTDSTKSSRRCRIVVHNWFAGFRARKDEQKKTLVLTTY